jgi:hypothetical protein
MVKTMGLVWTHSKAFDCWHNSCMTEHVVCYKLFSQRIKQIENLLAPACLSDAKRVIGGHGRNWNGVTSYIGASTAKGKGRASTSHNTNHTTSLFTVLDFDMTRFFNRTNFSVTHADRPIAKSITVSAISSVQLKCGAWPALHR